MTADVKVLRQCSIVFLYNYMHIYQMSGVYLYMYHFMWNEIC